MDQGVGHKHLRVVNEIIYPEKSEPHLLLCPGIFRQLIIDVSVTEICAKV